MHYTLTNIIIMSPPRFDTDKYYARSIFSLLGKNQNLAAPQSLTSELATI